MIARSVLKSAVQLSALCALAVANAHPAIAQIANAQTTTPSPPATMQKFPGVWVEGPGFKITYGGTYDGCTELCLSTATCVMIEYYRPQNKCNLYNTVRPRLVGGSSDVAVRR
jgi:hypothetical protein